MKRLPVGRELLFAGVSALAITAASSTVRAQSVNYGALEELYGEPVTTSVTGKPQKASEAPADIMIISQDDIRRSGANNIPDILQFVAGIDVRRYGAADVDVAVRGYDTANNPRLLVLVNGRQVYIDFYGFVAWQNIPVQLEEIRQIEIVKGPNTALFGFNAASGVINIITYDPLFDSVNTATMRFGSQALLQGSAVTTVHLGDAVGVRMSVGGLEQHEYTPAVATPTRNPALGSFNIDSKAQVAPGVQVFLEGSMTNTQNQDIGAYATSAFDTYHTNSVKAGVAADTAWGTVAIDAYRNWVGLDSFSPTFSDSLTDTVYVLQASDTLKLNADNTIRVSLEYRNNALTSSVVGGQVGYAVYSASGMWDWQITPALSFTNSVRIDYLSLYYSGKLVPLSGLTDSNYNSATLAQPSFNSGLVYKLTDQDTIRLTAGRGLQVPSLFDYAAQLIVAPPIVGYVGSPSVQPTAVWNLELGYDRAIAPIDSTVTASVFVQRNDNILTPPGGTPLGPTSAHGFDSFSQNSGYSDAVGGELGIKGKSPSGFRWNASYAFEVISDHLTINQKTITSPQNYQAGTPTSTVILGAGYTWQKLEIDAQGRWQSRFTDYTDSGSVLRPVYVDDYLTFMARVGYNLTDHVTLGLTGQQFNVSRLVQSSGPPVERSVIGSVNVHF
jgi:outer membrane receptor for ferrienterochelin and colicins